LYFRLNLYLFLIMKFRISLLAVVSLAIIAGCGQKKLADPILDLRFDGNLVDSSGNHHDATAHGIVHYGLDRFGNQGKALALHGSSYLSVPDAADLNFTDTSSFTISVWVKTTDTSDVPIVHKGPADNAVPGYEIGLQHGLPFAAITARDSNVHIVSPISVSDHRWHLLTLTSAPNRVSLYVDTSLVGQRIGVIVKPDSLNKMPLMIGGGTRKLSNFNGNLDGIMIRQGERRPPDSIIVFTVSTEYPPGEFGPPSPPNVPLAMTWINSTTAFCCGTNGLIEKSTNSGITWQSTWNCGNETLRRISFSGNNGAAVGDNGAVWTYGGGNWTQRTVTLTGAFHMNIHDVKFGDANHLYIVGAVSYQIGAWNGFVLMSTDQGATWNPIAYSSANNVWPNPIYCIGIASPTTFYAGCAIGSGETGGYLLRCSYDGTNWSVVSSATAPGGSFSACDCTSLSNGIAATDNGLVYQLSGTAWTPVTPPGPATAYYSALANPSDWWVAGEQGILLHSMTSGNWSTVDLSQGNLNRWSHISTADPSRLTLIWDDPTHPFWRWPQGGSR
jgi:hypothetical protein